MSDETVEEGPEVVTTDLVVEEPEKEPEAEPEKVEVKAEKVETEEPEKAEPEKKHRSAKKRIDRAVAAQRQAERERDAMQERFDAMEKRIDELGTPAKADKEPDFYDYDSPDEFKAALREYDARKVEKTPEPVKELTPTIAQDAIDTVFEAGAEQYEDFEAVVGDEDLPITEAMVTEVMETDDPAALLYYLGKHPDEAAKLAEVSERGLARAIGRIEARLEAPQKETPKAKQSKAPEPITPIGGGGERGTVSDDDLSFKDYERKRIRQMKSAGLA